MSSEVKVSIVIPCCNNGQNLVRAIDSILNSTFQDAEIIVVNYGSTDPDTLNVLNGLTKPRTRIIHVADRGIAHARNTGIREAQGTYIVTFQADDYIHHTYIQRAVDIIEANPYIGFVTPGYQTFGSRNEVWLPPDFHFGRLLVQNIVCESALFRKRAWEQAGGYNERMTEGLEDWDFWISVVEKGGWTAGVIPEALHYYRVDQSESNGDATKAQHELIFRQMMNHHPKLYEQHALYKFLYEQVVQDELEVRAMMRRILGNGYNLDPIVSVVIPCYNYGRFVEEAVDSCLNSTFEDMEVIVVNNGSTDPYTNQVLSRMSKPKTRVIKVDRNIGLPHGRNVGIQAAKGRYILPLDADDKIHPTLIEKTYRVLEAKPQVGFVTVGIEYFGDYFYQWLPPAFDFNRLLAENIVCVTSLFRKQAWKEVGGYNESMLEGYEDWDFWITLAEKGWLGDAIPEYLLYYRRHGSNMTIEAGKKFEAVYRQIRANHPDLYK